VYDELEIEIGDAGAGIAGARGRLGHVASPATETEETAFDRIQKERSVELFNWRKDESSVTFQLGESKRGAQCRYDGPDQVGQDVLGMIELDASEISGVPRYVGDEKAKWLRLEDGVPFGWILEPGNCAALCGRGALV
jgi:hypothetical protein